MPTEILDARLIDPASGRDEVTNIYCQDGKVVGIGQPPAGFAAARTLNAQGLVAAPGLVDLSVALREPGYSRKGNIASETLAGEVWHSKGRNCPFIGHCLPGAVRYTIVDGRVAFQG